ncbi:riboflavin synthase [Acetomicrobium sp. S15 = DSM 107314]|uniref:riboflavin synthase n=1 Tax=Acetomicrobium sp. S15 = DSM 107314 TaxID=2529858 RepID=UPI0018E15345|nr:riboflavin synthase [Acetomicrobium sp. S15 = DSM 107314]
MFTGIVEEIGKLKSIRREGETITLEVEAPLVSKDMALGSSVAVSGACLTVVGIRGGIFIAEMMEETAKKTKLSFLRPGDLLNLERSLKPSSRLDGHIVQGHVEGVGVISKVASGKRTKTMWIKTEEEISRYIVPKGSIAVDGVSLTVIEIEGSTFSVGLIPATLESTTLGKAREGDQVNIETDILGRYIERFLHSSESGSHLTWEKLSRYGWI